MFLEEIAKDMPLEDSKLECKEKLNREDVLGWLKSVAGFASASGGDLYIGVEDGTNKLTRFERRDADSEGTILINR